jgi:calcium/calmodulin-dependent protein kinase I
VTSSYTSKASQAPSPQTLFASSAADLQRSSNGQRQTTSKQLAVSKSAKQQSASGSGPKTAKSSESDSSVEQPPQKHFNQTKKKTSVYVPPSPITYPHLPAEEIQRSTPKKASAPKHYQESSNCKGKTKIQSKMSDDESLTDEILAGGGEGADAICDKIGNLQLEGSLEGNFLESAELVDFNSSALNTTAINDMSQEFLAAPELSPLEGSPIPEKPSSSETYTHSPDMHPEPNSRSGMRFDELYRLKGVLGTGAFSTVREGFHRNNQKLSYAVKCINRKKLTEEDEAALLDEVSILKEMEHSHIIRLYDFFEEPSTYYLVMERMRGGELFDRIVAKAYYNEKEARDTCKIVLEAVGYCHQNHVAHRDLKPENLLLLSEHDDSAVKIADFGFAKKVYKHNCLTTQCGTPGYVAPEILEGTPYDERADMWSVGVILYILLGGYPPFIESTQRDLFRKIRKGEYEFHEEYWGTVSTEAKDLISSLLTVDCSTRLTAHQALENGWILGDDAKLASKDLGPNLKKLANFNAKRKLRAAVSAVIAMNKLNFLSESFVKPGGKMTKDES